MDRDGVERVGVVVEDVTEQKELEHKFRHSQKMEAVGRLAAGIAHDYNNVLTIVNGNASLALDDLEDGHPAQPSLEAIQHAGERAAALTQRLLAFSRADPPQNIEFEVNDAVVGFADVLRSALGDDVVLELDLAEGGLVVRGDAHQFEQAVLNLTINARDAIEREGMVGIRTSAEEIDPAHARDGAPPGRYACVRVSDTGRGMDEATQARVFEPFFTTKRIGTGTGLGLSMVYSAIQAAEGFLTVESDPGVGTVMSIFLPMSRPNHET